MPIAMRDANKAQRRSSVKIDKVDDQKDLKAVTMPESNLQQDIDSTINVKVDSDKDTRPTITPMTPDKKRAAPEYSTPPSAKKIRVAIKRDIKNTSDAADLEDTDSKLRRRNKPIRIVVPKCQDTMGDHEILTPESLWEEKRFDLLSPRLIHPMPLHYASVEVKRPHTEGIHDRVFLPDAPADNIRKVLFLNPARTDIRWVGELSERKLARELAKYERIKEFWLFKYGHAYCPSWDYKHKFVAQEFAEEVQSPWVLAWLAELIGRSDVYLILDHLERKMREELGGLEDVEDIEEPNG